MHVVLFLLMLWIRNGTRFSFLSETLREHEIVMVTAKFVGALEESSPFSRNIRQRKHGQQKIINERNFAHYCTRLIRYVLFVCPRKNIC